MADLAADRRPRSGMSSRGVLVACGLALLWPFDMPGGVFAQQPPVFRTTSDLIAVNVQVVTNAGDPILNLTPDRFEVSINGRRRRLATLDLVNHAATTGAVRPGAPAPAMPGASAQRPTTEARVYVLALDVMSFQPDVMRDVVVAARRFVEGLQASDRVGLFAYPVGTGVDPTTDHRAVIDALETTVGVGERSVSVDNRFHLLPSTLVDLTAARQRESLVDVQNPPPGSILGRILYQICGDDPDPGQCMLTVTIEADQLALHEETIALQRVASLRGLLGRLGAYPGRKNVVLASAGLFQADIPGGRPDLGDLGLLVGKEAARANATIYALYLDRRRTALQTAASGVPPRVIDNPQRDSAILARPLDQMAAPSGGSMFPIIQGGGEAVFDRILAETSVEYLLGVEPAESDRDGQARRLTVNVKGLPRGAIVRSRAWVVVPRPGQSAPRPFTTLASNAPPALTATPPRPEDAAAWRHLWSDAGTAPLSRPTAFDDLYDAYASGQTSVVAEQLRTREDFERYRPDLLRTMARWRQEWSPRRGAFALEIAISAIARHWPDPRAFLRAARGIVTSRPDPPGSNAADDRFEILFHRTALALLAAVDAHEEVEAYLEGIATRVATDGQPPTAARLFDTRLLLARAVARERLTTPTTVRHAKDQDVPWSWVAPATARDEREELQRVFDLLGAAALSVDSADRVLADEITVRQAFVHYRLGNNTKALSELNAMPPSDDDVVEYWGALVKGRVLAAEGQLQAAAAAYEQAARLAPGGQAAAVALATLKLRLGDRSDALHWATVARTTQSGSDPWTTFWAGDSRFLPTWLAELRKSQP